MRPFPHIWKFKKYNKIERREKVLSIGNIIDHSTCIHDCLNKIKNITRRDINTIERRTRQQSKNDDWFHYRCGMITGTLTCRVSHSVKKGEKRENINTAITKREYFPLYYPAIIYGRDNEELGVAAFTKKMRSKHYDLKVKSAGLRIDDTLHFIGASVDGIVECLCCKPSILEVKCPYSIRDGTVAMDGYKLQYLTDDLKL